MNDGRLRDAVFADPRYLDYSRYGYQLSEYLEWFPRDQLLVLQTAELASAPSLILERVARFLDISDTWAHSVSTSRLNAADQWRMYPERLGRLRGVIKATGAADYVPWGVRERFRSRWQREPIPASFLELHDDQVRAVRSALALDYQFMDSVFGTDLSGDTSARKEAT